MARLVQLTVPELTEPCVLPMPAFDPSGSGFAASRLLALS
jgi:hypothetical protein